VREFGGLARRRDTGIASVVQHELEGEFHGDWAVEAAELLCDPQFLPALRRLYGFTRTSTVRMPYIFGSAIAACEGRRASDSATLQ
jgi:hypothetical protein